MIRIDMRLLIVMVPFDKKNPISLGNFNALGNTFFVSGNHKFHMPSTHPQDASTDQIFGPKYHSGQDIIQTEF